VNRLFVSLADGVSVEAFRAALAERVRGRWVLRVEEREVALRYIADVFTSAFAFTDSIQILIATVTVAGILDLVFSAIMARRRELALWRLIGADDRTVRAAIGLEALAIGVMGAALGLVVGVAASYLWITVNYRYLIGYFFDFHLAWRSTALSIGLVLGMTVFAGRLAARYALRQTILQSVRTD
jgi:putative ABC transport system permease protein